MKEFENRRAANLIPDVPNPSPDYYCTWQTQLYATGDGKTEAQRARMDEAALFAREKPLGWARFYEKARGDLLLVLDDGWDLPPDGDPTYYSSFRLNAEKFPSTAKETPVLAMKVLTDRTREIGWKGLGVWVCAKELDTEDGWKCAVQDAEAAGIAYWKVDWGEKGYSLRFRRNLTELAAQYAPGLTVEHALIPAAIPYSTVFRTYDVPAIMSIPMTVRKIAELVKGDCLQAGNCLLNCEDEVYAAAAGGFTMGIMRHPYEGPFCDGRADMSFPAVHRNLKSKMYEVIRAARFHRLAPAFGVSGAQFSISDGVLTDYWTFEDHDAEIESWWLGMESFASDMQNGSVYKSAPAAICRNAVLPAVKPDEDGFLPFVIAARNPNGVYSVATMGRTVGRAYFIPRCDVTVHIGDADTVGVFGEYKSLTMRTDRKGTRAVLMQDLAGECSYDVTDLLAIGEGEIVIPGELIHRVGTSAQPKEDTSEPGVLIQLLT